MKKHLFLIVCMVLGVSVMAQQKIQLRSADKAECVKSDMTSLRASFSFSTIEAENVETQRGEFSLLSMPNTVIGGNEGDPQIPVINEVIAVPLGAQPTITVTSYSTKEYNLNDLGIKTLIPRQPSLKNIRIRTMSRLYITRRLTILADSVVNLGQLSKWLEPCVVSVSAR